MTGHADVTDLLAPWALVARLGQSTVDLVSTSRLAVQIRSAFFVVQLGIQASVWGIVLGRQLPMQRVRQVERLRWLRARAAAAGR